MSTLRPFVMPFGRKVMMLGHVIFYRLGAIRNGIFKMMYLIILKGGI